MSRAYRIRVSESGVRTVTAEDRAGAKLEILDILPPEQMADLLARELKDLGFEEEGNALVRRAGDVTVALDPRTGALTAEAAAKRDVEVVGERSGYAGEDQSAQGRRAAEERLRQELEKDFDKQAEREAGALQKQVTDQLEAVLDGLRGELNQAVNRATAEALKIKAVQLGHIKEMTEGPRSGSLTIVVEV